MDAERLHGFQTSWTNSWKTNLLRIKYKDLASSWSHKLESGRLFCGSIATCLSCFKLFPKHLTLIIVGDKTKGLEWFPCRFPYSYSIPMFACCGLFSVYEFCLLSVVTLDAFPWEQLTSHIPKHDIVNGSPLGAVLWVPFVGLALYHLLLCVASAGCFFTWSSLCLPHVFNKDFWTDAGMERSLWGSL